MSKRDSLPLEELVTDLVGQDRKRCLRASARSWRALEEDEFLPILQFDVPACILLLSRHGYIEGEILEAYEISNPCGGSL